MSTKIRLEYINYILRFINGCKKLDIISIVKIFKKIDYEIKTARSSAECNCSCCWQTRPNCFPALLKNRLDAPKSSRNPRTLRAQSHTGHFSQSE